MKNIDYKNTEVLKQYLDTHARIMPRKKTRVSMREQRALMHAIKRARFMGLLPFVSR